MSKLIDIQAIGAEGNWKTQSNSLLPVFTPKSGQTVYEASDLLYKTKQGNYCFISGATDTKLVRLDFLQCCGAGVITSTDGAFPVYDATEADAEPEAVLMPMRMEKETSKTLAEMLFKIKYMEKLTLTLTVPPPVIPTASTPTYTRNQIMMAMSHFEEGAYYSIEPMRRMM